MVVAVEIEWLLLILWLDDDVFDFLVVFDEDVLREVERFSIVGAVVVEEE